TSLGTHSQMVEMCTDHDGIVSSVVEKPNYIPGFPNTVRHYYSPDLSSEWLKKSIGSPGLQIVLFKLSGDIFRRFFILFATRTPTFHFVRGQLLDMRGDLVGGRFNA